MQSNSGRPESQKLGDGHASRPQDPYDGSTHAARSLPVLLSVFLLSFFLVSFFFIYLLHCLSSICRSGHLRANSSPSLADHGLDPVILESFPMFPYEAVRAQREGKCELECAVCLSEFASGDVVRLLPVCCHAFHPACIDEWLSRHSSCPLCRSDLETPPGATAVQQDVAGVGMRDSHTIYVDEEEEGQAARGSKRHSRGRSTAIGRRRESVAEMENDDRYILRLTEAAEEQIAAYHMRAASR